MTFTGTSLDLARLADCCFGVTAPGPVLPIAQALVVEMGAEPVVVAEEARPLYHAALAHGANHLVTLVAQARRRCCARPASSTPTACSRPLLSAALDNALRSGDAALTGPVARGDAGTVAAHLAAMRRRRRPGDVADDLPRARPRHRRPRARRRPAQRRRSPRPCSRSWPSRSARPAARHPEAVRTGVEAGTVASVNPVVARTRAELARGARRGSPARSPS